MRVKRSSDAGLFVFWMQLTGGVFALALAAVFVKEWTVPTVSWICIAVSGAFHGGYFPMMAVAYRRSDISSAYPIVRGVAPTTIALWGVLVYGETPGFALAGVALIVAGVVVIAWSDIVRSGFKLTMLGLGAAVATGFFSAGYALTDKVGVEGTVPLLYLGLSFISGAIAQGIVQTVLRKGRMSYVPRAEVKWNVLCGLACIASYGTVLYVLSFSPVSLVFPVGATGVLVSVIAGALFFKETVVRAKYAAAALILGGISVIALS